MEAGYEIRFCRYLMYVWFWSKIWEIQKTFDLRWEFRYRSVFQTFWIPLQFKKSGDPPRFPLKLRNFTDFSFYLVSQEVSEGFFTFWKTRIPYSFFLTTRHTQTTSQAKASVTYLVWSKQELPVPPSVIFCVVQTYCC